MPGQAQIVGGRGMELTCPESKPLRERLRAMASDLVSGWRSQGVPASAKTAAGLRSSAEAIVARAGAGPEHVGWTMVTLVSEFWRDRLGAASNGRRLLLLPDCPAAGSGGVAGEAGDSVPRTCGPGCGIGTIWAAARDSGACGIRAAAAAHSEVLASSRARVRGREAPALGMTRLSATLELRLQQRRDGPRQRARR
jgi:hypothetical protein